MTTGVPPPPLAHNAFAGGRGVGSAVAGGVAVGGGDAGGVRAIVGDGVADAAATELGVGVVAAQPEVRAIAPAMATIAFQCPTLTAECVAMVTSNRVEPAPPRADGRRDHMLTPC